MLNNLVDSSDDSLDIKLLAILRQVDVLSNDISSFGDSANSLEERRNILKNGL